MNGQEVPIQMTERQLAKGPDPVMDTSPKKPLNDSLVDILRNAIPKADRKLTPAVIENISHNLGIGLPIEACCACVHVLPQTMKNWLKKGEEEVCNLSPAQLEAGDDILETLSPYGQLFFKTYEARGVLMADILSAIKDKMYEPHNEWLMTYMLERLDTETLNLKYKATVANQNNNSGTQNFVQIQFINGLESRPKEEKEYIENALSQLQEKYADKNGELTNVTPTQQTE